MRSILVSSVLIVAGIALATAMAEQKPRQKSEPAEAVRQPQALAPDHTQDEKAIRQTAEEFVRVYNAADAKALAALFTSDAEIVHHHGNAAQGRETIEQCPSCGNEKAEEIVGPIPARRDTSKTPEALCRGTGERAQRMK